MTASYHVPSYLAWQGAPATEAAVGGGGGGGGAAGGRGASASGVGWAGASAAPAEATRSSVSAITSARLVLTSRYSALSGSAARSCSTWGRGDGERRARQ